MKPTIPFLLAHPAHFIALGFGSGLSPRAPGTVGTILGWALYPLIRTPVSDTLFLLFLAAFFAAGVIVCDRTGRALGVSDHGAIVWDEMVGMWITLWLVPEGWVWLLLGFLMFRLFDIVKPWPIRWIDRHVHGGVGIMLDDVIAGVFAWLAMQGLVWGWANYGAGLGF